MEKTPKKVWTKKGTGLMLARRFRVSPRWVSKVLNGGGDDSWGNWRVHSKWPSKAAREREMVRLVHEEKCLCLDNI